LSIPKNAKPGDAYTVQATVDTGPFFGKLTATKKLVVVAPHH
jgi:hypothetical protein